MNPDQLAAEAAQQAWDKNLIDQNGKTPLKSIIKAVIEKAWQDGYVEGSNYQISIMSRAAHASEHTHEVDLYFAAKFAIPTSVRLIANERIRQISSEGYDASHDDEHVSGELVRAAMSYLTNGSVPWPWTDTLPKIKSTTIQKLTIAGALIAAEIDRLGRIASQRPTPATARAEQLAMKEQT